MAKKKLYLTLDTETATLPFVNEWQLTAKQKQNIAIAKPLVYDIGWTISDRNGTIYTEKNFLIQETFFVPQIFNTAYYKDKRPIYLELLEQNKIETKTWNEAIDILLTDLRQCEFCTAYNAAFDFKKAIPFTERYIKALYSKRYQEWEDRQRNQCEKIAQGENSAKNEKYLEPTFVLRNEDFPIVDLWYLACERLLNNQRYKDFCLKNGMLTQSGIYFKTSAETTFSYLTQNEDFIEDHTALSDAQIETEILRKLIAKGKINPTLGAFPFRELGETYKYVIDKNKIKYAPAIIEQMNVYLSGKDETTKYNQRIIKIIASLEELLDN